MIVLAPECLKVLTVANGIQTISQFFLRQIFISFHPFRVTLKLFGFE